MLFFRLNARWYRQSPYNSLILDSLNGLFNCWACLTAALYTGCLMPTLIGYCWLKLFNLPFTFCWLRRAISGLLPVEIPSEMSFWKLLSQIILFLKSMSDRDGSDIKRLEFEVIEFKIASKSVEIDVIHDQGRSLSDPRFSDIDFDDKTALVRTILKPH